MKAPVPPVTLALMLHVLISIHGDNIISHGRLQNWNIADNCDILSFWLQILFYDFIHVNTSPPPDREIYREQCYNEWLLSLLFNLSIIFLDYQISYLIHQMTENSEKCQLLFPKGLGNVLKCLILSTTQKVIHIWEGEIREFTFFRKNNSKTLIGYKNSCWIIY